MSETKGNAVDDRLEAIAGVVSIMDISECGVDPDGDPYVRLKSGEVFHSFPADERTRRTFGELFDSISKPIPEICFQAVLDTVIRYYFENSYPGYPTKTSHLEPGWGFIDAGAFLGHASIKAARKVGDGGVVVAIEASPKAYRLLKKNIKANRVENVIPVHAAVCGREGTVELFSRERQINSIYPDLENQIKKGGYNFNGSTSVPAKTIDAIARETSYPADRLSSFVCMEINGAEREAVYGMGKLIRSSSRLDLRITAVYGPAGDESCMDAVVGALSSYEELSVYSHNGLVYAYKYPVAEESPLRVGGAFERQDEKVRR